MHSLFFLPMRGRRFHDRLRSGERPLATIFALLLLQECFLGCIPQKLCLERSNVVLGPNSGHQQLFTPGPREHLSIYIQYLGHPFSQDLGLVSSVGPCNQEIPDDHLLGGCKTMLFAYQQS